MKPNVKILLPIWGEEYIRSFQNNGLRSLLAPGNVPLMSERCQTEFVFLTPARDVAILTDNNFYRDLCDTCSVKIIEIDDLLIDSSLYGYTLTYAYHRGILSAGDRLTETHFVFIVSDYVFSKNSFDNLSQKIVAGNQVVLSGSLRVDGELVGAQLSEIAPPDEPLAIPARDVLRLALQHPHPSLQSKIVNCPPGSGYSCNYQHLYWQVDEKTLLNRNFMSHMLCIRPDRCPPTPRGFCDYTFIPDMAPHAQTAWLDDSDDYFAMELQHRDHEANFTQPGDRVLSWISQSLSTWTTAGHREFADHTFVFHADEIPAAFDATKREADAYIAEIRSRMLDEPKSHLNHPHWDPVCEMIVERTQERWRRQRTQPVGAAAGARRFNFAMQVWGKRYIEVFLSVGLPSQLSAGNLENFTWLDDSVYEIYTTRHDAQVIKSSQSFRWLQVLMDVKIIYIDEQLTDGKWTNVRYCHREAVKSADARDAALFFLCPDQVWPDGSITNAGRLIEQGYTAVMCPGPRAIEEDMVPLLRSGYLSADGISLSVPPRDLVKAGLDHFHPEMVEWLWDAPEYFGYPSYAMFDVPGQGILAQCYILHPVVVNPQVRNLPPFYVFDQDYLLNACPDLSKIYVAQDSDHVFHFELSPRAVSLPPPARPVRPDPEIELMWYGEKQFNSHHRVFAKLPIRIHYDEIEPARWHPVEQRAAQIIARIDKGWDIPDWMLAYRYPDHLIRRLETRYRHDPDAMTEVDRALLERATRVAATRPAPSPTPRATVGRTDALWSAFSMTSALSGVTKRLMRGGAVMPAAGKHIARTIAYDLIARGEDRTSAPRITADFNHIISAEAGAGLMLPGGDVGVSVYIFNGTAQTVRIYASGSDTVDGVSGDDGVTLAPESSYIFNYIEDGVWILVKLASATNRVPLAERAAQFDPEYYLQRNPDVARSEHRPEDHFRLWGWREGRDPSAYFSVRGYLDANPDVRDADVEPLTHFRVYGLGKKLSGWQK